MKITRRNFAFSLLCTALLPAGWLMGHVLVLKNRWVLREDD